MVEDNEDDVFLLSDTFRHVQAPVNLQRVENGVECLAFLRKEGRYAQAPRPDLILLDLDMPLMDGRQVLAALVADPRMLETLMRNLLDNARKYSTKTEEPRIRIYADRSTDPPRYCITDNGAGIGIGLATVQRIVHRHGGVIAAQAAPGDGAAFCFTLPCGVDPGKASP